MSLDTQATLHPVGHTMPHEAPAPHKFPERGSLSPNTADRLRVQVKDDPRSVAAIALEAGISRRFLFKLAAGTHRPSWQVAARLADTLALSDDLTLALLNESSQDVAR